MTRPDEMKPWLLPGHSQVLFSFYVLKLITIPIMTKNTLFEHEYNKGSSQFF